MESKFYPTLILNKNKFKLQEKQFYFLCLFTKIFNKKLSYFEDYKKILMIRINKFIYYMRY